MTCWIRQYYGFLIIFQHVRMTFDIRGLDILTRSLGIFSSVFRDSCFDKLPGVSLLNKFFEDCVIFFLHFIRRANFICSVSECSYNILFVSLMMVRLEIKVPSRISGFSINSESKGGIVLLSFDEHIKEGDFVVLFTLAGKLNISIY